MTAALAMAWRETRGAVLHFIYFGRGPPSRAAIVAVVSFAPNLRPRGARPSLMGAT